MDYVEELNCAKKLPKGLSSIREFAKERHIPLLREDTERLLNVIVSIKKPLKILEIGTAIGYSGALMLSCSPSAKLHTIEKNDESIELAKAHFEEKGLSERVRIFEGDAEEIIPLLTGPYDFVFMDGPKGKYIEFLPFISDIITVGGVMVCDNVLYKGLVENMPKTGHKHITIARNMRAFLDKITRSALWDTVVLRVGDGVSVSIKKEVTE